MSAVLIEERDAVLLITLNRPAARNAIDEELSLGLARALRQLDSCERLRTAVVTGAAGTFCSGMDLKAWQARPRAEAARALDRLVRRPIVKPVIAAVEGNAVGGGLELAAAFDLVVAARDARFALPEVRWSLVPSGGGLVRLPERLGPGVVLDMALTGAPVGAERLHELGFVARLSEPGSALDDALALALAITQNGPRAVVAIKRVLRTDGDRWVAQDEAVAAVNDSEDAAEGVRAFIEKRPPGWRSP